MNKFTNITVPPARPTAHRAPNSLSRKKFLDRLDKGLQLFVANEISMAVTEYHHCRYFDVHTYKNGDHAEYVIGTLHFPSCSSATKVFLRDMNVTRNRYNKNFAFRTRKAAENYLRGCK